VYKRQQDIISDALRAEGYALELAANGEEGLKQFEASPARYDLVILDLNMPKLNGKGLLQRIKEIRAECAVIIITGYLENNAVSQLLELGAEKILSKPFDVEMLLDAVALCLSGNLCLSGKVDIG
jgi:DNA-binding response OmpR family regulator